MNIFEKIKEMDINNYTEEEIKAGGIVYTPKYIADFIIDSLNISIEDSICEPSVGHGVFIFALLEKFKERLTKLELKEWFLTKVHGYDIEEKNINDLKYLILTYFKNLNIDIYLEELDNFKVQDTLFSESKKFNVILGNPPYVRLRNLEPLYVNLLKKDFISCRTGNLDIYYAFIEHALKNSDRCSFIVPNSYIYNRFARGLRQLMFEKLSFIIDFKTKKIFEKADTYTSIFLCENKRSPFYKYKENFEQDFEFVDKRYFLDKNYKISISEKQHSFSYKSYGPIATLRDSIYKNTSNVDKEDTVAFLKLTDLKSVEDIKNNKERILFPYKFEKKFIPKEEYELGINTFNYLISQKEELLKRDKGNKTYPKWYSYGRTQGLYSFKPSKNKFIIIPGMFSEDYKFFSFSFEDINEPFLFSSGFLIETENDISLLNFLNSKKFFDDVKKIATSKPGKKPYYSLSKNDLYTIL
jgi:hypothetical protein